MRRVLIALTAAAALTLPAPAQDSDEDEGGFLENLIEERLSGPGFTVDIRGFEGALSSRATMARLAISDDEGPWLIVENAVLDWNRSALLRGRLEVRELAAGRVEMPRLPQASEDVDVPTPEARPFSLPELPVSIQIDNLALEDVVLGAPVLGEQARLTVDGNASLAGGEGAAMLEIRRTDGAEGAFVLDVGYANASRQLDLDLSLEEGPNGLVARLIDLNGRPALAASIRGSGPLSDFTADISLATDGTEHLDGTVRIADDLSPAGGLGFALDVGGDVTPLYLPGYREFLGDDVALVARGFVTPEGRVELPEFRLSGQSVALDGAVVIAADGAPERIALSGRIAREEGGPVLLPLGEGDTRIGRARLEVDFDATEGEAWTLDMVVEDLSQTDLDIAALRLTGGGTIAERGDELSVTADLDFSAEGVSLDDGGMQAAVGDTASGRVSLTWSSGAPLILDTLELAGATYGLSGSGEVDFSTEGIPARLAASVEAETLEPFSGLAGRPLGGGLNADLDLRGRVLDNAFDVALDGTSRDLRLDIDQLDRLLDGQTDLRLRADRDATGTRVTVLRLDNAAITLDGVADLTSEASEARLTVDVPDLARIEPSLAGPAALEATAVLEGSIWRVDLTAEGAGVRLAGQGNVDDLESDAPWIGGRLSLEADDLALFATVAERELGGTLDLTVEGSGRSDLSELDVTLGGQSRDLALGQPDLDRLLAGVTDLSAQVARVGDQWRLPRLSLDNPQIDVAGTARYGAGELGGEIEVAVPDLAAVVPELSGPGTLRLTADARGTEWDVVLDGQGGGITLDADVAVSELTAFSPLLDGTARVRIDDLSRFSRLAGRDLGGAVDLDVGGAGRGDLSTLDLTARGQTRNLALGQPDLDRLLDGVTDLTAEVVKDGDLWRLPRLAVSNPQISADGSGRYGKDELGGQGTVRLPDLAAVVPELTGAAEATVSAYLVDGAWEVEADADGGGLTVDADLTVADLDQAVPRITGDATLRAEDLSRFARLAGRDLGGAVALSLTGMGSANGAAAELRFDGTARNLALGQAELDRLLRGTTELSGIAIVAEDSYAVRDLRLTNPQVTLTGRADYGGAGAGSADLMLTMPDAGAVLPQVSGPVRLDVTARQRGEVWDVTADGEGAGATIDADVTVSGLDAGTPTVDGEADVSVRTLAAFSGIAGRPLAGSVDVSMRGRAQVDGSRFDAAVDGTATNLRLGIADLDRLLAGRATFSADVARTGPGAPIRVRRLSVDAPGADLTAEGRVLGGQSDLTFTARIADISPYAAGIVGPVSARGTVREAGADLALDVVAEGPAQIRATVSGRMSQSFDRFDLRIGGQAPLGLANRFIAPRSVVGTAQFDLTLNGPPALASLGGTVATQDARLVAPALDLVLNDINATVRLSGNRAEVRATASKQAGGQLSLAGDVGLSGGYVADLRLQGTGLVIQDPALYRATANADVTLTGPLAGGARIGGRVELFETEVRIPSTGLGATGPIPDNILHVDEPAAVRATRRRAGLLDGNGAGGSGGGGGPAYALNLLIEANNRIFVRGRGLDAELGGRLQLTGTTDNVIPAGQFNLIRGRLDILGKRLVLDEGRITLQGDFVPYIRLVAETEAGDVVVFVVVEGEATSPDISFLSDPDLPQDEALSRLLFGKSITDISPLQAAQLASAVATLAGRGGDGLVARLRRSFGLDDLDVTTDDDGNVGLRAGKYISENLYTDIEVNGSGEAEIHLNLDITPNLTVRGGASNTGETTLGIFFEKDY
ncbi:hypothetical protein DXV76_04580 [Rhodobacteraceae bacterium CCMM004]|nr:hypothetical protein DXV76_04580 [Rhodobacteraceae bacterium CCMM004]